MGRIRKKLKKLLGRGEKKSSYVPPSSPPPEPASPQEVLERMETGEELVVVDVREAPELRSSGIISGAIHIPLRELSTRWQEVSEANEVICYCAVGGRSYNAAMLLRQNGIFNATSMDGGISEWKRLSGPTEAWKQE